MKIGKKTLILYMPIVLICLIILVRWSMGHGFRDLSIYDFNNRCILKPFAFVPGTIPQEKEYDENFHRKVNHNFPSWWQPVVDNINQAVMPKGSAKSIIAIDNYILFITMDYKLYKFDLGTNQIKQITAIGPNNSEVSFYGLVKTNDGAIWSTASDFQSIFLAKYYSSSDQVSIVIDQKKKFLEVQGGMANEIGNRISELSNGQLIVLLGNRLFQFDPKSTEATPILENISVDNFVLQGDRYIWLVKSSSYMHLYRLNLTTGLFDDFNSPPQLTRMFASQSEWLTDFRIINLDNTGSVWVSFFDRLVPDGNGGFLWEKVDLPGILVVTFTPERNYTWASSESSMVDNAGNIWYTTNEGLVSYNQTKNKWCLSAVTQDNFSAGIYEDEEGNIWTYDRGQIYKLQSSER
jgi:hypothetical protein